jgi:hypothetical protein
LEEARGKFGKRFELATGLKTPDLHQNLVRKVP